MSYNIRFTPSTKQFEAYQLLTDNETDFIGYGGSAFSGKSYLLCYWITIMSLAYPDTGWGLGRKELTTLKKTTLLTLFKVFAECGIRQGEHYEYNGQLNIITFHNKSQIFLIDTAYKPSDPLYTRFGGLELTGAAVDESAETELKAIEILYTRLGRRGNKEHGIKAKLLETFNPAKNHVYKRYYAPFKAGQEKPGIRFIKALPADNPSPEVPDYIEGVKRTASKITIQRLIYGNFEYDDDPSALIQYDKILDLWHNQHVDAGTFYLSIDVARFGNDKSKLCVRSGWRIVRWVSLASSSVTETAAKATELMKQYQIPRSNVVADEDGVGGGVVDILGCKGFVNGSSPMEERNPANHQQIKPNYNHLKSQCYYRLADRINAGGIHIDCEMPTEEREALIEELEQVKQKDMDKDGKLTVLPKDVVKDIIGRSPDSSDCVMMHEYFELLPPKPAHTASRPQPRPGFFS